MEKYRVGILGATGAVGQRFMQLLESHPWFEVAEVVASERSAGKRYADAATWRLESALPKMARNLVVKDLQSTLACDFVFSGLDSSVAGAAEEAFARAGYPVISNSRNHRMDADVPLLIPEVNPEHAAILPQQQAARQYSTGFIATNPNCAVIGLSIALKPLEDAFGVSEVFVATMQAISGAGHSGVSAGAIHDNVIPYISGEEEKLEAEPQKILGRLDGQHFVPADFRVSAQCNRVAVLDGHMESVSVRLKRKTTVADVREALRNFTGEPQRLNLPSAPRHPITLQDERDRPQPRLDRNTDNGMTVVIGRIRPCPLAGFKFTVLSHNAIRGAAGAAILNAELLVAKGYLPRRTNAESELEKLLEASAQLRR
ncbi:MAG TPA: aspartate-semialdehyde dehydrogenase [Candidatus Limnocylindrales bacterium]|nr:aspartate-semialdehyde dehydrogenase [Candidatus Limnocylindrales bacterium]